MTAKILSGTGQPATLVELLRIRAGELPGRRACTFLPDGEVEGALLSYAELDAKARATGALLQRSGLAGERALLLYPPGLEFIAAFLGCQYGGAVAVPAQASLGQRARSRLGAIVRDAQPTAVLCPSSRLDELGSLHRQIPELRTARFLATDDLSADLADEWRESLPAPDAIAFRQYATGSTAPPKGVMVNHADLLHTMETIRRSCGQDGDSVLVSWLPMHRDMGLIGIILQALYLGSSCCLMPPVAFLQRPIRWLAAISRYRAHTSAAPGFAFDLCVEKVAPALREGLDLSSWRVAINASEPARAGAIDRFQQFFAPCGLDRRIVAPVRGLAAAPLVHPRPPESPADSPARESGRRSRAGDDEGRPVAPLPGPDLPAAPLEAPFPLSYNQRGQWFLYRADPLSAAYHVAFSARIVSALDPLVLRRAFGALLGRHEALRTVFFELEGEPRQRVAATMPELDFTVTEAAAGEAELRRAVQAQYERPFDLGRGPVRLALVRSAEGDHVLLLVIHHIAADGWSLLLLIEELGRLYAAAGDASQLEPPAWQYRHYVAWQRQMLAGEEGELHWRFWRDRLAGDLPLLELPTDRPRPVLASHRGASLIFKLRPELASGLRALARTEGATLFMVLVAAFAVLLRRASGQERLLLGSSTAGRTRPEHANLVGHL